LVELNKNRGKMRFILELESVYGRELGYNYQYPLSAAIYKMLRLSSKEFSESLHDTGYQLHSKTYKLFTFALDIPKAKPTRSGIFMPTRKAYLTVSAADEGMFMEHFLNGAVVSTAFEIHTETGFVKFQVNGLTAEGTPEFKTNEHFRLMSPLVLSKRIEFQGRESQYYLRPEDTEEINRILQQNLMNKYQVVHGKEFKPTVDLKLVWDEEYLNRNKRITKKITIPANNNNIEIIGTQAPFTITADPELLEIGYDCGFGEKNSMGFGLVKLVRKQKTDVE